MHSECASPVEFPDAKCICLFCKEGDHQPVTQPQTMEVETREQSEETEGHVGLVEMTIQTDADMVTEEQEPGVSEVTQGQTGTSETGQTEASTNREMPKELGKTQLKTMHGDITGVIFIELL